MFILFFFMCFLLSFLYVYSLLPILATRARCDYRTILCGGNKTLTRQNASP